MQIITNRPVNSAYKFLRDGSLTRYFGYKVLGSLLALALTAAVLSLFFGQRIPTNVVFSRLSPIELNRYGNADAVRSFPMRLRYDNDYVLNFDYRAIENKTTPFRACVILRDDKTNPTDVFCYEDKDGEGRIASAEKQSGQIKFTTKSKTFSGEVYLINKGDVKLEVSRVQVIKPVKLETK